MAVDLQALADEFTQNPVGMPYLAFTEENAVANADVINNDDGTNPRTVNQQDISSGDVRGVTTYDGFDGLVTVAQAYFEWLSGSGEIPVNSETLQNLAGIPTANDSIWAAGDRDEMNARMKALMQFQGSRAQEEADVLGASVITPTNVRDAVNL